MRIIYDDLNEFAEIVIRCNNTAEKGKCSYCPFKMNLDEFIADNRELRDNLMVSTGEIERLTEEVADLQEKVEAYRLELGETRVALAEANNDKRELDEENEGLKKNIETYRGRLKAIQKEIYNLNEKNKLLIQGRYGIDSSPYLAIVGHKKMLEYRIQFDPEKGLIEKTKAGTVRKMADKLKARFDNSTGRIYQGYNIHRFIDQITKEMLEETK